MKRDRVLEWLESGLQNRVRGFESHPGLIILLFDP